MSFWYFSSISFSLPSNNLLPSWYLISCSSNVFTCCLVRKSTGNSLSWLINKFIRIFQHWPSPFSQVSLNSAVTSRARKIWVLKPVGAMSSLRYFSNVFFIPPESDCGFRCLNQFLETFVLVITREVICFGVNNFTNPTIPKLFPGLQIIGHLSRIHEGSRQAI